MSTNIGQVVLNAWVCGFHWTDVLKLEAYQKSDKITQDGLAHMWAQVEWQFYTTIGIFGFDYVHPCDVTHRAIKKSRNR